MIKLLGLVAWLLLAGTSAAQAEPISIAILTAIAPALLGTIAVPILTFAVTLAVSFGASYLISALSKKKSPAAQEQQVGGTLGKLQGGGAVPRSFIVGRGMTAGSLTYGNTFGQDGNTPNAYLVQEIALSDLPVEGLVGVLVGGEPVTWNPGATPDVDGIAIPEYFKDGKDHLWIRFFAGYQTTDDSRLVTLFGSDPDRPYTTNRIGLGIAKVVITARVNQELFSGFPQFKFILDGVPLYDRRYDTTAGGSGSQRWSDPTTWAFTANNVVIIENILRGIRYAGKWLYGAQTVFAPQLPSASWVAAANECDVAVALNAGGTEPQFYAGGEIQLGTQPADAIEELLKGCNGKLAEVGGTYKMRAGAPGSAVFSFTDTEILSTEQQTFEPFPSLGQIINAVTAKYVSPAEAWNEKDAPPLYDTALEAADGGRRQVADVRYGFVTSGSAVQRLMRAERDDNRAWRRHALPMPPDGFVLEPLDVISWTSTRNGYAAKYFEVLSMEDLPNLNVGIALKELDPNAYDWDEEVDEQPVVDGSIEILRPAGQPIIDWFVEPYTLEDGGTQRPAIRLAWDPDTDDVNGVRFEVRYASTEEVILRGETDRFEIGSIIISQNLLPNTLYEARGQYRPASPRPVLWSDWLAVTTPNITVLSEINAAARFWLELMARLNRERREMEDLFARAQLFITSAQYMDRIEDRKETRLTRGLAEASIEEVRVVAVATDFALASLTTTVTATFGSHQAQITANATAFSGLNLSFANYQITTNASIGNLNAAAAFVLQSLVTIEGKMASQAVLRLSAGGKVVGFTFWNTGLASSFDINTTNFRVGLEGVAGFEEAFAINSVNGVLRTTVRGEFFADGAILTRMIQAESITADKIAANAITANKIVADTITAREFVGNAILKPNFEQYGPTTVAGIGFTSATIGSNTITPQNSQNVFLIIAKLELSDTVDRGPVPFDGTAVLYVNGNVRGTAMIKGVQNIPINPGTGGVNTGAPVDSKLIGAVSLVHTESMGGSAFSVAVGFQFSPPSFKSISGIRASVFTVEMKKATLN